MNRRRLVKIAALTIGSGACLYFAPFALFVAHLEAERLADRWGRRR